MTKETTVSTNFTNKARLQNISREYLARMLKKFDTKKKLTGIFVAESC